MTEAYTQFIRHLQDTGQPANTVISYQSDLTLFEEWYQETFEHAFEPREITPQDVRDYREHLKSHGYAAATINRRLSSIRAGFAYLLEVYLVRANPAADITGISESTAHPKWLERLEQNRFTRQLEQDVFAANTPRRRDLTGRLNVICTLFLNTGLRVSELCDLRLGDLTLRERTGTITVIGKGEKRREVPVNKAALNALRDWFTLHLPANPQDLVFPNCSPRSLEKALVEVSSRAGIDPPVTPHILRHTFAHNLVESGVSLDIVAQILGHDRLDTTRIYTQPGLNDLARAVERIAL